jgi:hypothetical protein
MSGGSDKTPATQNINSTTTTTNLPEYVRPYFEDIMNRAQAESNRGYVPYGEDRIAGLTPGQQATNQQVMGLGTPEQFGMANNAMSAGMAALARTGNYTPAQFNAMMANAGQVGAERVNAPQLQQYLMQGPQQFGQEQAQQYMSPYVQSVLNTQKREAITDAQKGVLAQNLNASRMGTYGGARQLLATTERERALGQQLGDIEARGMQSAYENAQSQFERDRAAQMGVDTTNLNALLGVQQLGAGMQMQGGLANQQSALQAAQGNQQYGLQAALANQQANLEAQRLRESSRQFGANLGLQGAQAYNQMGQTYANIGQTKQQADLARLQAQSAVGSQEQQLRQQKLDLDYADFLRQRDYPMEQLGYFSNLMHGVPVGLGSTSTTYAPAPSMASQVGGLGLGALGLYNMGRG